MKKKILIIGVLFLLLLVAIGVKAFLDNQKLASQTERLSAANTQLDSIRDAYAKAVPTATSFRSDQCYQSLEDEQDEGIVCTELFSFTSTGGDNSGLTRLSGFMNSEVFTSIFTPERELDLNFEDADTLTDSITLKLNDEPKANCSLELTAFKGDQGSYSGEISCAEKNMQRSIYRLIN